MERMRDAIAADIMEPHLPTGKRDIPVVSRAGFCVHNGKLTEPIDGFAQPFWNTVRDHVSNKAIDMRRQGFVGTAMLPMSELE